jgi:hypothetical protein
MAREHLLARLMPPELATETASYFMYKFSSIDVCHPDSKQHQKHLSKKDDKKKYKNCRRP